MMYLHITSLSIKMLQVLTILPLIANDIENNFDVLILWLDTAVSRLVFMLSFVWDYSHA